MDEARTLLPVLGALLKRAQKAAGRAGVLEGEMQELSYRIFLSGGMHVDIGAAAQRRAEREKAVAEARTTVEEIEEIGAQMGDLEEGRLEFPAMLEERVVLLCWTLGEEEIGQWRETEDEASTRRAIDGRFVRKERERPN